MPNIKFWLNDYHTNGAYDEVESQGLLYIWYTDPFERGKLWVANNYGLELYKEGCRKCKVPNKLKWPGDYICDGEDFIPKFDDYSVYEYLIYFNIVKPECITKTKAALFIDQCGIINQEYLKEVRKHVPDKVGNYISIVSCKECPDYYNFQCERY